MVEAFYDSPNIPEEDKQKLSDAIGQGMTKMEAEDYIKNVYPQREKIKTEEP